MSSEATDDIAGLDGGEIVVHADEVSKAYLLYDKPRDRLLQMLWRNRRIFYREFWALRNVSLRIRRGETFGIIGSNGAGKSTLLQLICGTLNPTSGNIEVRGRVAALLELGAGFNPEFTGRENVYLCGSFYGLTTAQIDSRFGQIAAFAEIGEFIEHPVKTYSSGMFVRLAFAVIAHVDADILVIDEALAVGDVFFTQRCMRFLRRFRETGTLIFVSHDTGAVVSLCERGVWIDRGEVRYCGTAKEAVDAYHRAAAENIARSDIAEQLTAGATVAETPEPQQVSPREPLAAPTEPIARQPKVALTFDPNADSHGLGGAEISNVRMTNLEDRPLHAIEGGESIRVHVLVTAHQTIDPAIVGFHVRDRLGQILFGETTDGWNPRAPLAIPAHGRVEVTFEITMPLLPRGAYSLTVAIAEGTVANHVHHHFLNEAMRFECVTADIRFGLVGIVPERITWAHFTQTR